MRRSMMRCWFGAWLFALYGCVASRAPAEDPVQWQAGPSLSCGAFDTVEGCDIEGALRRIEGELNSQFMNRPAARIRGNSLTRSISVSLSDPVADGSGVWTLSAEIDFRLDDSSSHGPEIVPVVVGQIIWTRRGSSVPSINPDDGGRLSLFMQEIDEAIRRTS